MPAGRGLNYDLKHETQDRTMTDEQTTTVELASGTFVHGGEFKHGGDTFDVAEATADEHAELDRVSGDESGGSGGEDTPSDGSLTDLDGVGDATADKLREAGYETLKDVHLADAEALAEVDGISADLAESLTEG